MDAFSYTDIFDTKGIEYLIVIGFLVLIVPVWIWLNRPVRVNVRQAAGVRGIKPDLLRIPRGIMFEKNHTWAFLEQSGLARVGVDDLLLHLAGGVTVEALRGEGEKVKKGELIASMKYGEKQLEIASPVSGTLKSVNTGGEVGSILNNPYKKGWLCKIDPENWKEETSSCLMGSEAESWTNKELDRMKEFFTGAVNEVRSADLPPVVMQAGGELQEGILADMPAEVWRKFQSEMLD